MYSEVKKREMGNERRLVMNSQKGAADTDPGHIDIVIVRQSVQHFHHWSFDQFQGESTDTAAPEETRETVPTTRS